MTLCNMVEAWIPARMNFWKSSSCILGVINDIVFIHQPEGTNSRAPATEVVGVLEAPLFSSWNPQRNIIRYFITVHQRKTCRRIR